VVTSQELADKFGISQRTVYRDIKALEEAGVPIIGEVGTGYCLMDNYKVPPVMFTEQEVSALITAQKIIKNNPDKSLQKSLSDLTTKVKAILKYSEKSDAEKLENRVLIFTSGNQTESEFLSSIQSAIIKQRVLKISYHTIHSDTVQDRKVEPLAVYLTNNKWLLIAYCRLRSEIREFRLDRVLKFAVTDDSFEERDFSFEEYIATFSENS
jgi:predicted DNA-binding transcriptional regulator YafY